jgi:ribonuclease P protein component
VEAVQLFAPVALKAVQDSPYKKLNSFSAGQRIPCSEGFANCLKSKSIANQYFKLYFAPNQVKYARLGIIASKKCMHQAIERNTNKRAVREIFRSHSIKSKNLDLVVLIRQTSMQSFATQRLELADLFSRLESRCA